MTEPSFLKQAGVDMRKSAPNRQFLPPDNPAWAQFFKK
jgi:branched-chain amino acid transport system substrate-binding protein